MKKIIECVPNFSEGRDLAVIKQITDTIESVQGVQLLDGAPWGLRVRSCRDLNFSGCYIGGELYDHPARGAVAIKGAGLRNLMTGTHIQGKTDIDNASDLRMHACIVE